MKRTSRSWLAALGLAVAGCSGRGAIPAPAPDAGGKRLELERETLRRLDGGGDTASPDAGPRRPTPPTNLPLDPPGGRGR